MKIKTEVAQNNNRDIRKEGKYTVKIQRNTIYLIENVSISHENTTFAHAKSGNLVLVKIKQDDHS